MGASSKKTGWLRVKLTLILKRVKEVVKADFAHGIPQNWIEKAFSWNMLSSFLQGPATPTVWHVA